MRLQIPGSGVVLITVGVLTVRVVGTSSDLSDWLTGGVILAIGAWAILDHFGLKTMHEANTRRLERIIDAVEGDDGLMADRRARRERRDEQRAELDRLLIRVRCLERDAAKDHGYEPPPVEEPHRRTSDPNGHDHR